MRAEQGRGSSWDLPTWPRQTTLLVCAVAPVVVATGVTAHYGLVPAAKSLAALGVTVALGFGLLGIRQRSRERERALSRLPGVPALGQLPRSAVLWLALALVLGIWLAATTAWWLLAIGVVGVAAAIAWGHGPNSGQAIGRDQLALVAAADLLAGWGTLLVELGRLTWLGLVAAVLPASLATALLILAAMRARSTGPEGDRFGAVAGLSERGSRILFQGLLVLSLAVPLLITIPGLDGAECFLPWLLAPLAEGPLRNSRSADLALRERAVRQTALLLLASSTLLAVGIWTG